MEHKSRLHEYTKFVYLVCVRAIGNNLFHITNEVFNLVGNYKNGRIINNSVLSRALSNALDFPSHEEGNLVPISSLSEM